MKFPSLKVLAQGAVNTIRRFPFEIAFALTGTIAASVNLELADINRIGQNWCTRITMMASLGLLISLAATLYTANKEIDRNKKWALKVAGALVSISLLFALDPGKYQADWIRFSLLSLALHLLVAYAAFTGPGKIQGFWQFNKTLFLRALTSALYSGVLYLGLAAAVGAMNFLFNFKFEWDTFANMFVWIAGVFNTLFFLAGVPINLPELDTDESYPKGLKVFTQYVLIPLATVYLLILLAYEIKILVQWQLPKGLVSHLILGYAVFGILALLLVYPIRNQEENKWLKTFTKSFYVLLIPLLGLLFVAAGTRIFRYGITEMRYFLILLACWLLFITVYFLASKRQNIKLIPISLSILTLLSIYGPQSAFSVSMYSQRRVLVEVFGRNNAFKDGKLTPVDSVKISKKDGNKAAATLDYLITKHDLESLQIYFTKDLQKVNDSLAKGKPHYGSNIENYELRYRKLDWVKRKLNLGSFSGYYRDGDDTLTVADSYKFYNFSKAVSGAYLTKGYDVIVLLDNSRPDTTDFKIGDMAITKIKLSDEVYIFKLNKDICKFDFGKSIDSLVMPGVMSKMKNLEPNNASYILPDNALVFRQQTVNYDVTLTIQEIGLSKSKTIDIGNITGYVLIKKRR